MMIRECAHDACGKTFEAKRADARFCSASCRAAASRVRRAGIEPRSGPTSEPDQARDPERAEASADDTRLAVLEERVMDLEGDVEAAEAERDGLRALRARLEAAVAQATTVVDEARGLTESVARATVTPVQKELAKVRAEAVPRTEVAELRAVVERIERRLAAMEERLETAPAPEDRLDDLEQAVIKLARRVGRLRDEFDVLVQAIANASP
ncbi:MAG: hypothetical protein R3F59_35560 [Myxococcota bacterium]